MIFNRCFLVLACAVTSGIAAQGQDARREADVPAVKITREPLCPGDISPLQYGQFVEYLCNLVPGMWAEKLFDGGFEDSSQYKFAFLKETDFREKPWYPSGAVNRASFSLDGSN